MKTTDIDLDPSGIEARCEALKANRTHHDPRELAAELIAVYRILDELLEFQYQASLMISILLARVENFDGAPALAHNANHLIEWGRRRLQ